MNQSCQPTAICNVPISYLRPNAGFTVIPWLYSLLLLSLHLPLVFVRIVNWEAVQWLTILMAGFSIGIMVVEYASTNLKPEMVYIWTPIIIAIDIGATLQIFVLVIRREGTERLRVWGTLMNRLHWFTGRELYELRLHAAGHENNIQPQPQLRKFDRVWVHLVLTLSAAGFIVLVILQVVGFIYAVIGFASHQGQQEEWCSPAFLGYKLLVTDNSTCVGLNITENSDHSVGCIYTEGTYVAFLKATIIILVLEFLFEILDAMLLLANNTNPRIFIALRGLRYFQRPWLTMFFGIGIWIGLIGYGAYRGTNAALPVGRSVWLLDRNNSVCQISNLYGSGLRGAIIAWSDGALNTFGIAYQGYQ